MAGSHLLSTLDVPWDILDECVGLALDIGEDYEFVFCYKSDIYQTNCLMIFTHL